MKKTFTVLLKLSLNVALFPVFDITYVIDSVENIYISGDY